MSIKELIKKFKDKTQRVIETLENAKNLYGEYLKGEEKKGRLDEVMTKWVTEQVEGDKKIKMITKWIIKRYIIVQIPYITQMIFDLIKTRVEGITE